jgi:TPR repeat protein
MENPEVTNFGNSASDPRDQPSNPELNPLQNPILGRNLGRWAQVYFTNPPEKREQAVVELLRELEKGGAVAEPNGSGGIRIEDDSLLCPICQSENQLGQKFCGVCGAPLAASSDTAKHDRAFPGNNPVPSFTPISPQGDAQWLRDKAFATFDSDSPRRRASKYLVAAVVVALAGLGYFAWSARSERAGATKPAAVVPLEPQVGVNKIDTSKPSQIIPADSQSEKISLSKPPVNNVKSHVNPDKDAPGATLAVQRQKLGPNSAEPTSQTAPENGAQELILARHYLGGKGGTRDTPEAVKWLWKAVGKQNTSAVLLLADLYIRGEGVAKNCDQARLLLAAAAKKGAEEAAAKLRTLDSNGCS